jgi:hypothetical protein
MSRIWMQGWNYFKIFLIFFTIQISMSFYFLKMKIISLGFLLFPNIKNFIVKLIKNLCEVLKTIMKLNLMDQTLWFFWSFN